MESKIKHFLYVPFVGLGLYGGFRGMRWFKNRIKIFKQFVVPSLKSQTNQNFTLWISFIQELRNNPVVNELKQFLDEQCIKSVFTYSGVCFWDDKYPDNQARERLITSVHGSMTDLINEIDDSDYVYMTIQPSDDCYHKGMVEAVQEVLKTEYQACGFTKGYICNYLTKDIGEYNPTTNPPFYTIKFTKEQFTNPLKHLEYTGIKRDVGKYKAGTPIPSHEYVPEALNYKSIDKRGFLVGCHLDNISTFFNHPFKGENVGQEVFKSFGLENVERLKVKLGWRRKLFAKLPYKAQRKLRYLAGEKKWILKPLFKILYDFLRS